MTYTENRILQNDIAERKAQRSRPITARNTFKRPINRIDDKLRTVFWVVVLGLLLIALILK